ncbi:hypothetical protein BDP27DRAFT_1430258 [Rhodocollybia butyracea]|uniref:Uncharacterized protein n=1 Tax=Rhodocollybia butyracea TaxID=206335 RepID=A0A9P5PCM4_9AGAR|nr:hypothetical protein BDP27DRAFT_1430258 [Rhodocollybia butyracea]
MVSIESKCDSRGIPFSASDSRLRCMPHTVHLAAINMLEAIGAISDADSRKASSKAEAYQETVREQVERENDEEAVLREDEPETESNADVSLAIHKYGLAHSVATHGQGRSPTPTATLHPLQ